MDPNTRQAKRSPVTLKIKFKSASLEEFIERYAVDVSHGGIFIRTKEPLAVGTTMKFEFQLKDATPLIGGEGTVVWTRENDPARPGVAPGMGVRFDRLNEGSQTVLDRILAQKAKSGASSASTVDPKVFEQPTRAFGENDVPTRVAPSPLAAAGGAAAVAPSSSPRMGTMAPPKSGFQDERTDMTPLPNPVPFHSDADEFPDEAFEEATKVRSLDELVAQTAKSDAGTAKPATPEPTPAPAPQPKAAPAVTADPVAQAAVAVAEMVDELAARRAAAKDDDAIHDPAVAAAAEAALVEAEAKDAKAGKPATDAKPKAEAKVKAEAKAKPKSVTKPEPRTPRAGTPTPVATAAKEPATAPPPSSSMALPVIIILLLLVGGAAAAYFFWYKDRGKSDTVAAVTIDAAPAKPVDAGTIAMATVDATPVITVDAAAVPVELVAITIGSNVKGATVEVVGTDQTGPAPFKAKLEAGKTYVARVTAPGFVATEIEVSDQATTATAKLEPMPSVLHVGSNPEGAAIYIDGEITGKVTPADIALSPKQAAKPSLRIVLRKAGYDKVDMTIKRTAFAADGDQMLGTITGTLKKQGGGGGNPSTGSGSAKGSGTGTASGSGTGTASGTSTGTSATPGSGTGTASGSASGTASGTGAGTGTASGTGTKAGSGAGAGSGTGSAKPGSGSGTGTGSGTGSAKPGSGSGSAKPGSGSGTGTSSEPTPDWAG